MREKKNCDCGIRERKRNKGGRRREGGMTFRGRRREEWRQKGGTLCDSSKGWEKKKERKGRRRRSLSLSNPPKHKQTIKTNHPERSQMAIQRRHE